MSKGTVTYYPYSNDLNENYNIPRKLIEQYGYRTLNADKNILNAAKSDILILSWYEHIYGKTIIRILINYLFKIYAINKITKTTKIVPIFHNTEPHDQNKLNAFFTRRFTKHLYKNSSKIITMTKNSNEYLKLYLNSEAINKKAFFIPQINYINLYDTGKVCNASKNSFNILFFGGIRPYKNIDKIIYAAQQTTNKNIKYTITGYPLDDEYANQLKKATQECQNIIYKPNKVPANKIADLFSNCNICVFPFSKTSVLNSGSLLLAFSCKRTVICPNIAAIKDYENLVYTYDYNSDDTHKTELLKAINKSYDDWKKSDTLQTKGNELYKRVQKNNSEEIVELKYEHLLQLLYDNS